MVDEGMDPGERMEGWKDGWVGGWTDIGWVSGTLSGFSVHRKMTE